MNGTKHNFFLTVRESKKFFKIDGELWQCLESTYVFFIILALPSGDQAEVLTEWLANEYIQYQELTEAIEVWCYRSKVSKGRLSLLGYKHAMTNTI